MGSTEDHVRVRKKQRKANCDQGPVTIHEKASGKRGGGFQSSSLKKEATLFKKRTHGGREKTTLHNTKSIIETRDGLERAEEFD